MRVTAALRFIRQHPVGKRRTARCARDWLVWQLGSRLLQSGVVVSWVGGARLLVVPGMTGATGNVYVGLHEFEEMAFFLHLLRSDDLFVDIGANVGSYTVLASTAVGCRCVSFEPHPATFRHLMDNIRINDASGRVVARQIALGRQAGEVQLTGDLDTVNHIVPGDGSVRTVTVHVSRLDDELKGLVPTAMKVDVEGFESEVLAGAESVLHGEQLSAIVMELNGSGARYGFRDQDLHERVVAHGFVPCTYSPLVRSLQQQPENKCPFGNGIYVRRSRFDDVRDRLRSAEAIDVKGLRV